ncbi:MAG TPA: zinc ribbon domain-containing protein [Methanoregula sp.]|nr:zinc ribbon domain-containing protein [Methanoregula sp.]
MGDPELRSDEKLLVRTQGVYVKSIPFEGILTNKRIILIDRAKNLLPTKEIPLVTIKEIEPGENAIRDQIITVSVMAKTGELRQMILTFSREAGGNRIKERDAWVRLIRENASSPFDRVIRKVIPGPDPALRKPESIGGQRSEVIHSQSRQTPTTVESPPSIADTDGMSPVRRSDITRPVTTIPPSIAVTTPYAPLPGISVFCSKCGNKVPAESVFCNRCGSPLAKKLSGAAPVQSMTVSPVVKQYTTRPIDEEIQSIEPLIEPSTNKIPPDALRAAQAEPILKPSVSWDDESEDEKESILSSVQESKVPVEAPSGMGNPQGSSKISTAEAAPSPVPLYGSPGDTQPPLKPPGGRSFIIGKNALLTGAIALIAIMLVAAGAFFVLPLLAQGALTTPGTDTGTSPVATLNPQLPKGTIVVIETPPPVIPATGVFVHVAYLGGWKGMYGQTDAIVTVPGNSGDRIMEIENANATVQATFEKLDGSSHDLIVEIFKDGKVLTRGSTTVGHGSVSLSVDTITGKAAVPITSGNATVAKSSTPIKTTTIPVASNASVKPTT